MEKKSSKAGLTILRILMLILLVAVFAEQWLIKSWSDLSADEVLFHTKVSLAGTNPSMIFELVTQYMIWGAVIFFFIEFAGLIWKSKKGSLPPGWTAAHATAVIVLMILIIGRLEYSTKIPGTFLRWCLLSEQSEDFIADHYADPKEVRIEFPEQKRNLIYIFLESMETTYADQSAGGAFEQGCISNLTKLSLENESFDDGSGVLNGGISLPGSNWTMGAMFAQSSGLPLQVSPFGKKMDVEGNFFPNLTTLGDILEGQGYHQELLLGTRSQFGGRKEYYKQHGGFDIVDYDRLAEDGRIPADYYVWWGIEDEKLFAIAKEELLSLAKQEQPFHLSMLTVDTHFPDGYVCDLCQNEFGDNQYANVFACSDRQTAAFVDWIKQQDFYENTTIILAGDHPTMDADFCLGVADGYQRKTYFTVINGAAEKKKDGERAYSTMDLFPTTIAAMGASIGGERLGLGTNLYGDVPTLLEELGKSECDKKLALPSNFMKAQ